MHTSLSDFLSENNPDAVKFDNLDAAIIGVGNQYTKTPLLVYSAKKIMRCLMKSMTYDEAAEWYGHNIECLWAGDHTPIIVEDRFEADLKDQHPPTDQIRRKQRALSPHKTQRRDGPAPRKDIPRVQGSLRSADHQPRPAGRRIYRRKRT
jgi:hypothetical protein